MFGKIRKNKSLTIRDKLRLIEKYENGLNARQLQEEFQCGKTQVYETLKRRIEIQRQYSDGSRTIQVINGVVWDWVLEANSSNTPITGEKLKERARAVAEKLGNLDFRPTNDWLSSFRTKHNLVWSNSNSNIVGEGDQELLHVDHDMEILPNTPLSVEIEDLDSAATTTNNNNTTQMAAILVSESLQNGVSELTSQHRHQGQDEDRLSSYYRPNYGTGHAFDAECEESVSEIPVKKTFEELAHEHFIRFVDHTLQSIPNSYRKDMAKLEIQQVLIKYKHSVDVGQPSAANVANSDQAVSSS